MSRNNELTLPLVITVVCVVIVGFLGYIFFQNKIGPNRKTVNQEIKKVVYNKTNYADTVSQTLDWLEKQKNTEGGYILEKGCLPKKGICGTVWDIKDGNRDGLLATYARFKNYLIKKNQADLLIIKNDIDAYLIKYKNGTEDGLWTCRIAYEMSKSGVLDQDTNNKLEKICLDNKYLNINQVKTYWTDHADKIKNIPEAKDGEWNSWLEYSLLGRGFDSYLGYPSEFLAKYEWKKDSSYLAKAKEYLLEIEKQLDKQLITSPNDICLVGISSLEMYKISKDNNELSYAGNIFEKYVGNIERKREFQTALCGLMTNELLNITNDKKYFDTLEANIKLTVSIYFDGANSANKIAGDGGFYKNDNGELSVPIKNISENSLETNILIN